jgi:ribosomal protein S18 acetylase RimI-like enzyme
VTPVDVRPLNREAWPEAMRLCGRAFRDYEYARALFGDDPLDRLARVTDEFASVPWDPAELTAGAWSGAALVGLAGADPPGRCRVCRRERQERPPAADPIATAGYEFERERRAAHSGLAPHSQLRHVAVEPGFQGLGVGRTVVRAVLDALRGAGGGPIVLECVEPLEPFYAREGFETVGRFGDPIAADLLVMRRELDGSVA